MRKTLPAIGRPQQAVLDDMRAMKSGDADWQHGRVPLFVFKATDELYETGRAAFIEYFAENALGGRRAFPSVKRMEDEVVEMALSLFHAPDDAAGLHDDGWHGKHHPGGPDLSRLDPRSSARNRICAATSSRRSPSIRRSTRAPS